MSLLYSRRHLYSLSPRMKENVFSVLILFTLAHAHVATFSTIKHINLSGSLDLLFHCLESFSSNHCIGHSLFNLFHASALCHLNKEDCKKQQAISYPLPANTLKSTHTLISKSPLICFIFLHNTYHLSITGILTNTVLT